MLKFNSAEKYLKTDDDFLEIIINRKYIYNLFCSAVYRFTHIILTSLSIVKLSSTEKYITQLKIHFEQYLTIHVNIFE